MGTLIRPQAKFYLFFAAAFGVASLLLMGYYLSDTLVHFTTPQQFPINSFSRLPLTLLIFPAEMFSFIFALYFVYSILSGQEGEAPKAALARKDSTRVAILVPVYNEPREIVERTLAACRAVRWSGGTRIYLLDDSTDASDRASMESLARRHACVLVRRKDRDGYKAGNVNNGVAKAVEEDYFVILDSDQAPEPDFLERTMDHFSDSAVAFVQTPQHFIGETTAIERAAKIGTDIFYHAQCTAKSKDGALPFCGTNAIIRTSAFREVKGFSHYTATEDIELGMRLNEAGYRGVYVPEILVHGYAPPDFKAYSSQQYRWANGNLAILREAWPRILFGRFSFRQQVHYLFTLGWWVIGLVTLMYILVPMLSLSLGLGTHHTWLPTTLLLLLYVNMGVGVLMIYIALHGRVRDEPVKVSDAILQYLLITNSAFIYARAAANALLKRYVGFVRTSKKRSSSGLGLIKWNLILGAACLGFSAYALYMAAISSDLQQIRTYLPVSLWLLFYGLILGSSILFVGKAPAAAPAKTAVRHVAARQRERQISVREGSE